MEVALSVFVEMIRNLREVLTYRIFDKNIFATLARVHGFKKRSEAELSHKIRTSAKKFTTVREGLRIEESKLILPQIHWAKQLRPEADESYLDVLSRMEEKGIPIPLRTWAAAGGVNLDKVVEMLDEDAKYRKTIDEYKKRAGIGGEEEGGAWGSLDVLWDKKGNFLALKKKELRSVLKSIRSKRNEPPMKVAAEVLDNNTKKLEAIGYLFRRTGITPKYKPEKKTITKVAAHLNNIAEERDDKATNRKVAFEYAAMGSILNPERESKLPQTETKIGLFDPLSSNSKRLFSGV